MTRQKKEIVKKINHISDWISADMELGCGFAPLGAYDGLYKQLNELEQKLATLCHYDSIDAMYMDDRWIKAHTL